MHLFRRSIAVPAALIALSLAARGGEDNSAPPKWQKDVRRITEDLGRARDLDVQSDFVGKFLEAAGDRKLHPGLRRLLLRLRQRRAAIQGDVVKALDRLEQSGSLREMEAAAKDALDRLKDSEVTVQSPVVFLRAERLILRRLEELLAYRDCLDQPDQKGRHHEMRIATKRLRYTMEICQEPYEGQVGEQIKAAKRLQTLLGDIHDCDVWVDQLEVFLQEERDRTVSYLGHAGPIRRLEAGILHLQQDRRILRDQLLQAAADYWRNLGQAGLWDRLISTVLSRVQHPTSLPAGGGQPAVQTPPQPAQAAESPQAPPPGQPAEEDNSAAKGPSPGRTRPARRARPPARPTEAQPGNHAALTSPPAK